MQSQPRNPSADTRTTAGASPAQQGLWLVHALHPDNSLYNVFCSVRLRGPLESGALRAALRAVTDRHEVLRTTYPAGEHGPVARVAAQLDAPLEETSLPAGTPDAELREFVQRWCEQPFDLATGPLLRAHVIRTGPAEHVFCLALHHIVCDGQSMSTLFDELSTNYTALASGNAAVLPSLPAQYRDYAAWQQQHAPDSGTRSWWRSYLAGVPHVISVPADRPRPAVRSTDGATTLFEIPAPLMTDLAALAARLRVSPFMVLLGGWAALLGRLAGVSELLVGVPFSHRPLPEFEPLIGLFVENLPVRVDVSPDQTFEELFRAVRGSVLGVLSHQEISFDQLVAEVQPDRSPGHTPLVQVAFSADLQPFAEPQLAGLDAEILLPEPTAAKFDLDVSVYTRGGDVVAALTYSTDLFGSETAGRLTRRFVQLLTAAAAQPDMAVGAPPLATEDELPGLLGQLALGGPAQAAGSLAHEVFTEQATATPSAPALSTGGREISYAELDRRSDLVSEHLRLAGVRPDDLVGVLAERNPDLPAALLGILKAGAAYLPLSSTHPPAYLSRLLATAGAQYAIAGPRLAHRLAEADVAVLAPGDLMTPPPEPAPPAPKVSPENLAYVLFTSGSTGEPKGVAITHRSLSNVIATMRQMYELTAADRVLQFANIGFDIAVEEMFPTWSAGGCVIQAPEPPPDPAGMTGLMNAEGVTFTILTSSYWQQWVACARAAGVHPAPSLRLISVGAEPVDPQTLRHWLESVGVPVWNAYGLTETTVNTTLSLFRGPFAEDRVPVGRPIRGVDVFLLDSELNPVPPGVAGQVYAAGDCLARGYLARPELTAGRFVPNPFSPVPGARMLRTGDLARWRPDGTLEASGRLDDQLKLRGYRIEPGHIEAAMRHHPGVRAAVATVRPGPEGQDRLVGYVVPATGTDVPVDLRSHLAGRLPAYLIPAAFVPIPAVPMNANGKVDLRALPEPAAGRTSRVPPGTSLERRLAEIWQQVLRRPDVGIHDNFFDSGGTSLLLTALLRQLNDSLGRQLPLVTLYEFPTIASLAGHLAASDGPAAAAGPGHGRAAQLRAGRARTAGRLRNRA